MINIVHDTHIHLDLFNDINQIVSEIEKFKIKIIAVTNLPILFERLKKKITSEYIQIALGFHPQLISEYNKYIPDMWEYIKTTQIIGEVGLDFSQNSSSDYQLQVSFFQELIKKCNFYGNKILSVHSRKSENKIIEIIGNEFNGKIILHWYSGSMEALDKAINNGYYFSINSAMLYSNNGKKIICKIPKNKILLESDCPFIKMNYPSELKSTAKKISELLNIDELKFNEILSENFNKLFQS